MSDAMAILDMEMGGGLGAGEGATKDLKKKERVRRPPEPAFKRPEGMHRELYALLSGDSKDPPPIVLTDVMPGLGGMPGGYKQIKAKLGLKKVRPWKWIPFVNPGRKDGFRLHHWRRVVDEGKEYPFAKFNKSVSIPSYSDDEYKHHLQAEGWSKAETDHLFDLCHRFDLRFIVMADRWDREHFPTKRSVEDLKERFYGICNTLARLQGEEGANKMKPFDAAHERKRKDQLNKLYNRTPEQVEEEENLKEELRKIEARKKEREKKTQDLQKLITAADATSTPPAGTAASRKSVSAAIGDTTPAPSSSSRNRSANRKKVSTGSSQRSSGSKESTAALTANVLESAGIKFPEIKTAGPSLRSARMKLPSSVGQKRAKAIEQLLHELNIELRPMPTEDICLHFNELRSDMVLLYELKSALANCEFELQTLKHQYEAVAPASASTTTPSTVPSTSTTSSSTVTSTTTNVTTAGSSEAVTAATATETTAASSSGTSTEGGVPSTDTGVSSEVKKASSTSEVIASEGSTPAAGLGETLTPNTPTQRKRRAAAMEQQAFMKKMKKM